MLNIANKVKAIIMEKINQNEDNNLNYNKKKLSKDLSPLTRK